MNYTYYRRYKPSKKKPSSFRSFFWLVIVLVVLILLLRACVSILGSMVAENRDEASLTINAGSAEVLEWGQEEPEAASDTQILLVGDRVRTTDDSIVTLSFSGGLELRLDQNTSLTFTQANIGETADELFFELNTGRVWVEYAQEEDREVQVQIQTDTMDLLSFEGSYLVANLSTKQYVYPFEGELDVDFVDREGGDLVIESLDLRKGQKTILTEEAKKALLARENIQLVSEAGEDFLADRFVQWNLGTVESLSSPFGGEELSDEILEGPGTEEAFEVDENEGAEEVPVEEAPEVETLPEESSTQLNISVTSPGLNATIQKSAIAIEGSVLSGTANTVTVTWAGNNQPYTLNGFAPGDTEFRYVADASYGNLKAGSNTYTVIAYDAQGQVSNTLVVTIVAEF